MSEKKNLSFYILEILKKYTSTENRLTQNRISELLKEEYGKETDRRTVKACLESLSLLGYNVKCETLCRKDNGNGQIIKTDWYIDKLFTAEETEVLLLSLYQNSRIPKNIIQRITGKLSPYLTDKESYDDIYTCNSDEYIPVKDIISTITSAKKERKMLSFSVVDYVTGGKKYFEQNASGQIREYLVKPAKIICSASNIYLFGELADTGIYKYFSIDRLYCTVKTNIPFTTYSKTKKPALPENKIESKKPLCGEKEKAVISIDRSCIGEVFDNFGNSAEILYFYGDNAEIAIKADFSLIKPFVLHYGSLVEVISPTRLRKSIAAELKAAESKYVTLKNLKGSV